LRDLKLANQDTNPLLARISFKMATGSGKTVVMLEIDRRGLPEVHAIGGGPGGLELRRRSSGVPAALGG